MSGSRIVLFGEAMLELSVRSSGGWQLGYGGDTLNTAIHLARSGHQTSYMTAIGSDPLSADLKARWAEERLNTAMVLEHPKRTTGLYAISTDAAGERSFSYWRDNSAVRDMFSLKASRDVMQIAETADLFAFSLISLAVLPETGRRRLLELAATILSQGGIVAFDGNFRTRLWDDAREARRWRDMAIATSCIGLPTQEDEVAMGCVNAPATTASHWQALGCLETVVKLGEAGCLLPDGRLLPPPKIVSPVDTSGAGDAFNAGYLSARLNGLPPADAASQGHSYAGWTIMRRGAIPERDATAPYPYS